MGVALGVGASIPLHGRPGLDTGKQAQTSKYLHVDYSSADIYNDILCYSLPFIKFVYFPGPLVYLPSSGYSSFQLYFFYASQSSLLL